jgi:NAD-dependent dihydropyrimidine dehydrogenase PreA subunit
MRKIWLCKCAEYGHVDKGESARLAAALRAHGDTVELIDDLCHAAALDSERMQELASFDIGIACYPRAVKALFARWGLTAPPVLNLRTGSASALAKELGVSEVPAAPFGESEAPEWIAWYPVIDYSRCVGCGKCVDFCMFGVYSKKDGNKVAVEKPANCKTNCPACARMCPAQAIIFPKVGEVPINGAEPVATVKRDTKSTTGLMDKLKARNAAVKPMLFKDDPQ